MLVVTISLKEANMELQGWIGAPHQALRGSTCVGLEHPPSSCSKGCPTLPETPIKLWDHHSKAACLAPPFLPWVIYLDLGLWFYSSFPICSFQLWEHAPLLQVACFPDCVCKVRGSKDATCKQVPFSSSDCLSQPCLAGERHPVSCCLYLQASTRDVWGMSCRWMWASSEGDIWK